MNVHIVHLPHTFPYLVNLSFAFHHFGFEQVTLVANGFSQDEFEALNNFASKHTFINVLDIPTKRILSHGQALNFAFKKCEDELFCFADHDIFPKENILQDIQSSLRMFDVVCLGNRPENTNTEYKGFAASATKTQSGIPLATSFFSIYKRSVIENVQSHYKVGFEQYFRTSQLPHSLSIQKDIKLLKEPFLVDTCKALSLGFNNLGYTVTHLSTDKVCHFGGLAGAINRFLTGGKFIKKVFTAPELPDNKELERHYETHQKRHPVVLELKRCISDYSLQLIISLQENTAMPQFFTKDDSLRESISQIEHDTQQLFLSKK